MSGMRFTSLSTLSAVLLASAIALSSASAHAQAELVPTDAPKPVDAKVSIDGWNPFLSLTSTFNLVSNSNVIGQVNGTNYVFGLGLLGGAEYIHDRHVFLSTLTLSEAFARTPVIDHFIKTNDAVKLEGIYNYFLDEHFGGYGRLSLGTSLFESDDVRGTPTNWVDVTGTTPVPLNQNSTDQHLANAFKPFTITESAGMFADPIRRPEVNVSFRAGVGGRSTFANGTLVNHDDATTPDVELVHLSDVEQLGVEAFGGANGKLEGGKLNYKAGLAVLFPFVNNDAAKRSAGTLTRLAFEGNLTYTLSSWLSLVYAVTVTRDPQLFPLGKDQVQVQNTLLLTFQLNLVKKKEAAKAKTKEQQQLEDAIKRANDAEKRANEAEAKLRTTVQPAGSGVAPMAPPSSVPPPTPSEPTTPAPAPAPAPTH
jgi:hypothetical protein